MKHDGGKAESTHGGRALAIYAAFWKAVVIATLVLGSAIAVVAYGPLPAALVFASSVCMGAIWIYVLTLDDKWEIRRVVEVALLAGTAVSAVAGLGSIIHGWAACIALLLVGGSPTVLRLLGVSSPRTSGTAPSAAEPPHSVDPTNMRTPPQDLDDAELCRAWRDTGQALSRRHSTRATLALVTYRMRCLDEIERRNPKTSLDWLMDGPPLGVDARSYLPPGIHGR